LKFKIDRYMLNFIVLLVSNRVLKLGKKKSNGTRVLDTRFPLVLEFTSNEYARPRV